MNDGEFRELVEAELRGEADPQRVMFLHDGANINWWRDLLVELLEDVNSQLTQRKANLESFRKECLESGKSMKSSFFAAKEDHDQWRAKAVYRKKCVERKLREVKRLRAGRAEDRIRVEARERWRLLEWAADLIPQDGEGAAWHRKYRETREQQL